MLAQTARRFPTRPALLTDGRTLTYAELVDRAHRCAAGFRSLGLGKGDRVGLYCRNTPHFVVAFYGALEVGAICSAANPALKAHELGHLLGHAGARMVVADAELASTALQAAQIAGVQTVIIDGQPCPEGAVPFERLLDHDPPNERAVVDPRHDLATIQYTSGTTDEPRGAMMTHRNLVANALQNAQWFSWRPDDVVLGALPLCHTWGTCVCMCSPFAVGASVALLRRFTAAAAVQAVERFRATILYGSATMFFLVMEHLEEASPRARLESLRLTKAGAMPIPEAFRSRWNLAVPSSPLVLGYGLTEASPETHNWPPGRVKAGTIGIPIVGTDAKVVSLADPDCALPPGEIGELCVRGPQVMKGYWRAADATALTLRDGWLHTGDVVRMDDEGYFVIVDRKKDLIKHKGFSVFPAEIESVLYTHPGVLECAVVGIDHARWGEVPKAFVVPRAGAERDPASLPDQLIAWCRARMASYKVPQTVELCGSIPRTYVGKALRRKLR